jgi:hypothetical protein
MNISTYEARRRNEAILWAQNILANSDDYLIVDTETTGLKHTDVIVHFAVMNLYGYMLIDTLLKPTQKKRMPQEAGNIHGIGMKDLKTAPYFERVLQDFLLYAEGKTILIYNAEFHSRMIEQTYYEDGIAELDISSLRYECIQEQYQNFHNRAYLAMPGRDNTGKGDCEAALRVITLMATAELVEIVEEEPEPVAYAAGAVPTARDLRRMRTNLITVTGFFIAIGIIVIMCGQFFPGFLCWLVAIMIWTTQRPKLG